LILSRPPSWRQAGRGSRGGIAVGLFPIWISTLTPDTPRATNQFLRRDDLPAPLRRVVTEGRDELQRALRARAVGTRAAVGLDSAGLLIRDVGAKWR
jgi:aminopeptidase N